MAGPWNPSCFTPEGTVFLLEKTDITTKPTARAIIAEKNIKKLVLVNVVEVTASILVVL